MPRSAAAPSTLAAIQTANGNYLTAVNGGGLGGPNTGAAAVPVHTDASVAGSWETFTIIWLNSSFTQFALKTLSGNYVTAVNGGGVGGPNSSAAPIHTDAKAVGPWETLRVNLLPNNQATISLPDGRFLTAVGGGGMGGPNTSPIHTDAVKQGAWEVFKFVNLATPPPPPPPNGPSPQIFVTSSPAGYGYIAGSNGLAQTVPLVPPGRSLAIYGNHFWTNDSAASCSGTVQWVNGGTTTSVSSPPNPTWLSDTGIWATAPISLSLGLQNVVVQNSALQQSNAVPVFVSYSPTISSVTDTNGNVLTTVQYGQTININGAHFLSADGNYAVLGPSGVISWQGGSLGALANQVLGNWTNNAITGVTVSAPNNIGAVAFTVANSVVQVSAPFPLSVAAQTPPSTGTGPGGISIAASWFVMSANSDPQQHTVPFSGTVSFSGQQVGGSGCFNDQNSGGSGCTHAQDDSNLSISFVNALPPSGPPQIGTVGAVGTIPETLAPGTWSVSATLNTNQGTIQGPATLTCSTLTVSPNTIAPLSMGTDAFGCH